MLLQSLYRNQSIDLLCKSIDWFLHKGNTGINGLKGNLLRNDAHWRGEIKQKQ